LWSEPGDDLVQSTFEHSWRGRSCRCRSPRNRRAARVRRRKPAVTCASRWKRHTGCSSAACRVWRVSLTAAGRARSRCLQATLARPSPRASRAGSCQP
jgi:hypothetical protein